MSSVELPHAKTILVAVSFILVVLCGCERQEQSAVDKPDVGFKLGSNTTNRLNMDEHLSRMYSRFNSLFPGRGVTDYPGHTSDDIPKAYAMILLAELDRQAVPIISEWPDLSVAAGYWLLRSSDLNRDGIAGWGVPIAWDAYGDGSENPENTEYTISTAIVVHALLDWMQRGAGSPDKEIISVVLDSIKPYIDQKILSPSGLLPYSLQDSDRKYDTFNPAAYLAGQMQRLSSLVVDQDLSEQLREVADCTMSALLRSRKISPETGAWYWSYSIQEETPNDLPHAAYIVEGIATYVDHGGRLADQFDLPKVFAHLSEFLPEKAGSPIRGWPRFWISIKRFARSYDIGMALSIACSRSQLSNLVTPLQLAIDDYLDGDQYLRNPRSESEVEAVSVLEYEAYLYRGLTRCRRLGDKSVQELRYKGRIESGSHLSNESQSRTNKPATDYHLKGKVQVPNVKLATATDRISVLFDSDTAISELLSDDKHLIRFERPGVPVWMNRDSLGQWSIFFRSIPEGRLSLVRISENGSLEQVLDIGRISDAELMFRAAAWHQGTLYLVAYDNPTLSNYLVVIDVLKGGNYIESPPIKLPSFQDPAGGTYEMIPCAQLVVGGNSLYLFAGTLRALIADHGAIITEERLPNCLRVVEASGGTVGAAALCQAKEPENPLRPYFIVGTPDTHVPSIDQDGVPWMLRFENGKFVVNYATSPQALAAMLDFDLRRIQQSGWMEFGIDNTEGRIPWSQIYYLNGYLDLLLLADRDPVFGREYSTLLDNVRKRLDMEMQLVDRVWRSGRYLTRAFTVDRSEALFAVQTSRLLLLMDRYRREISDPLELAGHNDLRNSVLSLDRHIEVLSRSGEKPRWLPPGMPHLRWPHGSKFYFDGTAVPFNHQNEWAYAVLSETAGRKDATTTKEVGSDAEKVVRFFLDRVSSRGELPRHGVWDYWWGTAYDGWSRDDGVSVNKPEYAGDKIKAWISFRSIDAMAALTASTTLAPEIRSRLIGSISSLVFHGHLYPFVSYELLKHGQSPAIRKDVAIRYSRVSSPWELQNAAWAHYFLGQGLAGD